MENLILKILERIGNKMPYIQTSDRILFEKLVKEMNLAEISTAGELNYLLTQLTHAFLGKNVNYQDYNDALGALEGCKLELYRRYISEYENVKISQNGDVP